ncbi:class II aldolase/adducin family protein [Martelella soudanensis]|uniref:class II aldolase/adducin family protein n=1 Tax=unclassified Martelella TaxID=2629616 RepID=UPI0015DE3F95|nr:MULTISPECIES: class II aldolase/adducin family protein [unclassified Martelella]
MKLEKSAEICDAVSFMEEAGLNHGSSGNISIRHEGGMLITPAGARASNLSPERMVWLDLDGGQADGEPGVPSTEWRLHTELYINRPEIMAVVHSHPDNCVALSSLRTPIPPFHYMVAGFGGNSVPCARYEPFGSDALADAVVEAIEGHTSCLMANHGMISVGKSLRQALDLAVKLETLARQYLLARQAGHPVLLTDEEMADVHHRYKFYGTSRLPR